MVVNNLSATEREQKGQEQKKEKEEDKKKEEKDRKEENADKKEEKEEDKKKKERVLKVDLSCNQLLPSPNLIALLTWTLIAQKALWWEYFF